MIERLGGEVAVFKDDQEVYEYIGKLFQDLATTTTWGRFRKADTIVQYQYRNPDPRSR